MENKTLQNGRIKELADRLRGDMSYAQHYAYLLDWYMNDKNKWNVQGENHVKESLSDVLDSLKHLERRIDRVSSHVAHGTGKEIRVEAKRQGNIFTRLIDARRLGR